LIGKASSQNLSSPVILVTGKNGQVGWELQRSLMSIGTIVSCGRQEMDLSKTDSIVNTLREIKPDVIVNAAAYTAVDKAEEDTTLAMQVNEVAPAVIAEEAHRLGALLIHYSTDYVFDGKKTAPYSESDEANPVSCYGRTKLAGERAIQSTQADAVILRTSWVYTARAHNFLLTIFRLIQEREELRIVADQIGAPTWARLIADTTAHVIRQSCYERASRNFKSDLYHMTSSGETSWHGFAKSIAEIAQTILPDEALKLRHLEAIATHEYPTAATRPMNSRLSTDKLVEHFSLKMPTWRDGLELCMKELV